MAIRCAGRYPEECYFTFTYSPIRNEGGRVEGLFCAVTETTERVIGERRLRTLRELADELGDAKTEDDAFAIAGHVLARNPADLPFALLYRAGMEGPEPAGGAGSAVERAGVALEIDCPPLPHAVRVDRDMWEKIVLNLVSNALKFTFDGTIAVQLFSSRELVARVRANLDLARLREEATIRLARLADAATRIGRCASVDACLSIATERPAPSPAPTRR